MRSHSEAQHVAEQILEDAPAGTEIFFSDEDDATAHYNELQAHKGLRRRLESRQACRRVRQGGQEVGACIVWRHFVTVRQGH